MVAASLTSGCVMSWQAQPGPAQQIIESTGESEIRLTFNDGTNEILRDPAVEGDSLIGWRPATGHAPDTAVVRRAYALTAVRAVSVKKSNTGANIAIGAGIGAALFIVSFTAAVVIVCSSQGCD